MNIRLDPLEARVLGALVEKEITTPDQYPLSLNALVAACNQKTNREPVLELDERAVQETLDRLSRRHLVMERSGFGSRVLKYRQRLCNGEHNPLRFDAQELAIVCELLLRGPQTPGELRGRAQRLAPFAGLDAVEAALARLADREDGPFVVRLERQPGSREARWAEMFTGAGRGPPAAAGDERGEREPAPGAAAPGPLVAPPAKVWAGSAARPGAAADPPRGDAASRSELDALAARLAALEATVAELRTRLQALGTSAGSAAGEPGFGHGPDAEIGAADPHR